MNGARYFLLRSVAAPRIVLLMMAWLVGCPVWSQITSPGLGRINDGLWLAAGIRQNLDSAGHTQSMTFVGNGRTGLPHNYNLVQRNFIWVLNQEFTFRCKKHFQPSAAISFRRQNEYSEESPYAPGNPAFRYEVRFYGRAALQGMTMGPLKWGLTFRQELRCFYEPDWHPWEENLQLRSRLKGQLSYVFSSRHRLTVNAESLFASSHFTVAANWNRLTYTESRFSISYSFSPAGCPFTWSIGYMNDLIGQTRMVDAHILMMDITWKNIFSKKNKK